MDGAGFRPTHQTPREGLLAWDAPDPSRVAATRLDPDLSVQLLAETTGWARVRCSNGWETWVDAALLVPIPFRPSRAIPPGGLGAWAEPDASQLPDHRLEPGLQVELVEEAVGWARVRCSNGWETWTDGRALVPISTAAPAAASVNLAAALVAIALPAALVIVGSVLAWFSFGGESANAWDIKVVELFTHEPSSFDLKTGPVLLVVALAAVVLIPVPLAPRVATIAFGALGAIALILGAAGLIFYFDLPEPRPDIGIGMLLTITGGLTLAAGGYLAAPHGVRLRRSAP